MNARILIAAMVMLVSLHSCNNVNNHAEVPPSTIKDSVRTNDSGAAFEEHNFNYANTILNTAFADTAYQHFSDAELNDRFTFYVPAGNINVTKAILTITDHSGTVIYTDTIKTSDLINGYDLYQVTNESEMESYLLGKAKAMLDTSSFCTTADIDFSISDDTVNDTVIATTSEIEREHRLLFSVHLNEENGSTYGYSRRLKRVVLVFSCC